MACLPAQREEQQLCCVSCYLCGNILEGEREGKGRGWEDRRLKGKIGHFGSQQDTLTHLKKAVI